MSTSETIVCKPTKWFLWRAIVMLGMFLVLGAWFLKDWRVGYPKENVAYYTYQAFEEAQKAFVEREKAGQTASEWRSFGESERIPFPDEEGILPAGMEREQGWPEVLLDYGNYREAIASHGSKVVPALWSDYSNEQGWPERPKTDHDSGKIRNQLIYAIICGVLAAGAAFVLVRCWSREMKVDGEAFYAPGGERIPFASIERIDKRKWETKGLATVEYRNASGEVGKAKVDGMVYGQFQSENGAPAQALFERILANFSGELVELEGDESPVVEEEEAEVREG